MLVSIAVEGGIADNLSGLMSEFYLALLSQRALQIYDYGYLPKYEPAFQYVYPNYLLAPPLALSYFITYSGGDGRQKTVDNFE